MNTWTDEETRELVTLWPTHSAMQIAIRMHRPRAAICAKANRLRRKGLLPDGEKHFDLMHPLHGRPPQVLPLPPPPPPDDRLAMRPCSLLDLNDRRCIGHSRIRDGCCSAAAQQRRGVVPIAPIICGWRAARTGAELPETMRLAGGRALMRWKRRSSDCAPGRAAPRESRPHCKRAQPGRTFPPGQYRGIVTGLSSSIELRYRELGNLLRVFNAGLGDLEYFLATIRVMGSSRSLRWRARKVSW
jgi:hypothetical protein